MKILGLLLLLVSFSSYGMRVEFDQGYLSYILDLIDFSSSIKVESNKKDKGKLIFKGFMSKKATYPNMIIALPTGTAGAGIKRLRTKSVDLDVNEGFLHMKFNFDTVLFGPAGVDYEVKQYSLHIKLTYIYDQDLKRYRLNLDDFHFDESEQTGMIIECSGIGNLFVSCEDSFKEFKELSNQTVKSEVPKYFHMQKSQDAFLNLLLIGARVRHGLEFSKVLPGSVRLLEGKIVFEVI